MEKLFLLLELQRRAQEAETRQAFAHIAVNETHKLTPYRQAIFWRSAAGVPVLEKVSGTAVLDDKGPYALAVRDEIRRALDGSAKSCIVLAPAAHHQHVLILPFKTAADGLLGGLWLESEKGFVDADIHILEELAFSYAHALALLSARGSRTFLTLLRSKGRYRKYLVGAALLFAVFPTRLSITAPAEIVARDAEIITIPYDGMIEKIKVSPGDKVVKGQVVAAMEHTALAAQMDMAAQELKATESSVARLSRESLATPEKKGDLTAAASEIESKRLQLEYAQDLSERSEIKSNRDGIAVFSDTTSLEGKPMATGEKVMVIADSSQYDVLIRIPVDAMVPVSEDSAVTFYLNVSPLSGYDARIKSIGYQASPDSDGLLTYKIHAVPENADEMRIGWKGTARIHGNWTIMSYAVLRRPLAVFRRLSGL